MIKASSSLRGVNILIIITCGTPNMNGIFTCEEVLDPCLLPAASGDEMHGTDNNDRAGNGSMASRADHHHRTPYRLCRIISLHTLPARYWIFIVSIIFLLLPGSNDLLYIDHDSFGRHLLGNSCTTGNEWTWIGLNSMLLILPHIKSVRWIPPVTVWRPKISWVQLNFIWCVHIFLL